jgi:hypothetical protein
VDIPGKNKNRRILCGFCFLWSNSPLLGVLVALPFQEIGGSTFPPGTLAGMTNSAQLDFSNPYPPSVGRSPALLLCRMEGDMIESA